MGLLKKHHSPRYIADRLAWGRWQKANSEKPWLVPASVDFLAGYLKKTDTMVEFGSGRSTRWFSGLVGTMISVEDNREWYGMVQKQLSAASARNVRYMLAEAGGPAAVEAAEKGLGEAGAQRVDAVLDDGMARDDVALWAVERLAPGGILIIDNVNRYLPCSTRSPESIGPGAAPISEGWTRFAELTASWRRAWWTQGVTDTAVFFKPAG